MLNPQRTDLSFRFGAPGWNCTTDVSNVADLQSAALAARHTDANLSGGKGQDLHLRSLLVIASIPV